MRLNECKKKKNDNFVLKVSSFFLQIALFRNFMLSISSLISLTIEYFSPRSEIKSLIRSFLSPHSKNSTKSVKISQILYMMSSYKEMSFIFCL